MDIKKEEYREIGKTGIMVSPISLGTMEFDKLFYRDADDADSISIIRNAIEMGVNFFDTAEAYGEGHSEEVLGKAVRQSGKDVVILSKLATWGDGSNFKLDAIKIRTAVENSLRRLQRDYMDLYLIHWPTKSVSMEWVMEELMKLKDEGKIKALGVSNFNLKELELAGKGGDIAVLQSPYSLAWRCLEKDVFPYCIKKNISVIPYSPLGQGILSGVFTRTSMPAFANKPQNHYHLYKEPYYSMCMDIVDLVNDICGKYGYKTAQVALAWLYAKPIVCSILMGIETKEQMLENLRTISIKLSDEDIRKLDEVGLPMINSITPVMEKSINGWWPDKENEELGGKIND